MDSRHVAWRASKAILILLGTAALVVHGFMYLIRDGKSMPSDTEVVGSLKSPDGAYKAVTFASTGPGLDPYCINEVSVVGADTPDANAWSEEPVFVGGCISLPGRPTWTSPRDLQIKFNPKVVTDDVDHATMRDHAASGKVHITFAANG